MLKKQQLIREREWAMHEKCIAAAERGLKTFMERENAYASLADIARAPDADGREMLLALRGIGPWSADIYYLMALRRPDVWPVGDLALAAALPATWSPVWVYFGITLIVGLIDW